MKKGFTRSLFFLLTLLWWVTFADFCIAKDGPFIKCGTEFYLYGNKGLKPTALYSGRPELPENITSHSGHFKIHYDLTGIAAVNPADENEDGIPDYVEHAADIFEEVWHKEIDIMGYSAPLSDNELGGGPEYDIYIVDFSTPLYYGLTTPDYGAIKSSSSINIDNDYQEAGYPSKGIDGLRVTAAHEFFHSIHFSLYGSYDASWWMEQTAVWMEDQVYDDINDYRYYLGYFFELPRKSLNNNIGNYKYGACIFPMYLSKKFGTDIIRQIWEKVGENQSVDLRVFNETIPGGLGSAFAEFNRWNFFTGSRAVPDSFYEEGAHFPKLVLSDAQIYSTYPVVDSSSINHMACDYLLFYPDSISDGSQKIYPDTLIFTFRQDSRGGWSNQLILYNEPRDFTSVSMTEGVLGIPQWREYDMTVFIPTQTALDGNGFTYKINAEVIETETIYVWPGDTDNDGVVGIQDVLRVGYYFDLYGYSRNNANLEWTQQSVRLWDVPDGTYADSNGDGIVTIDDLEAIALNWGQIQGETKPVDVKEAYHAILEGMIEQPDGSFVREAASWAASKLEIENLPLSYELLPNRPNPFNTSTVITFILSWRRKQDQPVTITLYNISGQEVYKWTLTDLEIGEDSIIWDTRNSGGNKTASGVYFIHFQTGDFSTTRKMLLIR